MKYAAYAAFFSAVASGFILAIMASLKVQASPGGTGRSQKQQRCPCKNNIRFSFDWSGPTNTAPAFTAAGV